MKSIYMKGLINMKIYSEKTRKEYPSVEDCLKAEKAFDEKKSKEEAEKAKLAETRKIRAKEVEDAYADIKAAQKKYMELRNAFVKDYGSFHMTFSNSDPNFDTFFNDFFTFL